MLHIDSLESRRLLASISGTLWNDSDADGVFDSNEGVTSSRTVFVDANKNAKLDAGERSTTSASSGKYTLANLSAGTHNVTRVFASGYRISNSPLSYIPITVTATQVVTSVNIGTTNKPATPPPPPPPPVQVATIRGTLWNDTDGDGTFDSNESATSSRTVFIDANANAKLDAGERSTTSASNGTYAFANLPAGTHNITRVFPSGYQISNAAIGYIPVTVDAGQTVTGINIGSTDKPKPVTPVIVLDAELLAQIPSVITVARTAAEATIAQLGNDSTKYIDYSTPDGAWNVTAPASWSAGFWPGSMWQLYQYDGNTTWRDRAARWTTPLSGSTNATGDLAFKFMTTYLPLYQHTGSADHRAVILAAAASKNKMWNEKVGAFRTTWFTTKSGNPKANFAVLMDMTTDLELMYWAGKETGNQQYIDRATRHFQLVTRFLVASDGGTRHFAMFDSTTGQFVLNETYQGYANDSTWARGQAWAVLSFANTARDTGRADFLAAAQKVADFFLTNLPADSVPFWDFNDPAIPNTWRDSSAAAVAASGLVQLSKLTTDPTLKAKYQQGAEQILKSLIANYLITDASQPGLLKHGALDVPHRAFANDVSLTFGDYYFLEALNRYRAL